MSFFKGFFFGAFCGGLAALFFTPHTGEETRSQLKTITLTFKDQFEETVLTATESQGYTMPQNS